MRIRFVLYTVWEFYPRNGDGLLNGKCSPNRLLHSIYIPDSSLDIAREEKERAHTERTPLPPSSWDGWDRKLAFAGENPHP